MTQDCWSLLCLFSYSPGGQACYQGCPPSRGPGGGSLLASSSSWASLCLGLHVASSLPLERTLSMDIGPAQTFQDDPVESSIT